MAAGQLPYDGLLPAGMVLTGGTSNLLADHVTACQFNYNAAASMRNGLVTLEIKLTSDNNESVWLMQQAHVSNLP